MSRFSRLRLLITAMLVTGALLITMGLLISFSAAESKAGDLPSANAVLAQAVDQSNDECMVCHADQTPGIVTQHASSQHFANNVSCSNCHLVDSGYPGAVQHPDKDYYVLSRSSPAMCETCHTQQVQQFNFSRHALPSYVAYAGKDTLSPDHLAMYQLIPEALADTGASLRNAIAAKEGADFTLFTCQSCHDIGAPNPDGSVGDCTDCHIRHTFSLAQARRPETCNNCHIGPDHPQWEIYVESPHGIAYMTLGDTFNWDAIPGTLTTADFPAPTCSTCHFSGFGTTGTTHDVGDRLSVFLAAPLSTQRPNWGENRVRMQGVCASCHSDSFVGDFYTAADLATTTVNDLVLLSNAMLQPLKDNNLLTAAPFDDEIDYVHYEIWHHYGRTAKSGVWMQGGDYAQWHGIYEILKLLVELRDLVDARLIANGLPPLDLPDDFPSIDAARAYLAAQGGG